MRTRKKVILPAFVAFTVLLFMSGCRSKITSGEVISKTFTPAHVQLMMVPVVISNGTTSTTTVIPYYYYYADKWEITIEQYSSEDEEPLRATYRVSKEVYEAVDIGAEFVYQKDMEPDVPEYVRKAAQT